MMRIVKKSKSFSQKKSGYKIAKTTNKFYSLLTQIDDIEKSLKRLKHTLKLYSDVQDDPMRQAVFAIEEYLQKYGDQIGDPKKVKKIDEILDVLNKFADRFGKNGVAKQISRNSMYSQEAHNPENLLEGFVELLEYDPKTMVDIVEENIQGKARPNMIRRRNYNYANIAKFPIGFLKKLAKEASEQKGREVLPLFKKYEKMTWVSAIGLIGSFILGLFSSIVAWPLALFFAITGALSYLKVVNLKEASNEVKQKYDEIISDLYYIAYLMDKNNENTAQDVERVVNYIVYGSFETEVSKTDENINLDLDTMDQRVKELKEYYMNKRKFKK